MTSNPLSSDFSYKKYSLEHLEEWVHDALNCEDLTPQDIYNTITNAVDENIEYHKKYLTKNIELLSLLKGQSTYRYDEHYDGWDVNAGICSLTGPDSKEPIVLGTNKDWDDFWHSSGDYVGMDDC